MASAGDVGDQSQSEGAETGTTTAVSNASGTVDQTPASPTSHKFANQVMPQTLNTNNNTTTAAEPKNKTCYILVFPHSVLIL